MSKEKDEKTLAVYTPIGSKTTLQRMQNYDQVKESQHNVEERMDLLQEALTIREQEAVHAAYGNIPPLVTFGTGLVTLNKDKMRVGWKLMRGKGIALSDILRDQYRNLVEKADNLTDEVTKKDEQKREINGKINTLYTDRGTIYKGMGALNDALETCQQELDTLRAQKAEEDAKEVADFGVIHQYEEDIRNKEQEFVQHQIEREVKIADANTKGETIEILTVFEKQIDAQRPLLYGLQKRAQARVEQADTIIEIEARNLNTAEAVIAFTTEFRQTREVLGFAGKVNAYFNQNLDRVLDYVSNTPIVDEKDLAIRVQSIGTMREAAKNYLTGCSTEGQLLLHECYERLALPFGASEEEIDARCAVIERNSNEERKIEARLAVGTLRSLNSLAKGQDDLLRTEYKALTAGKPAEEDAAE
ncbi:MAG: hypothetical protein V1725_06660 [archaeon]